MSPWKRQLACRLIANRCDGDWWRHTIEGVHVVLLLLLSTLALPAATTPGVASGVDDEMSASNARYSIWIRRPHRGGYIEK